MPSLTTIDHVSLSVRDLDLSARWYDEILGLAPARRVRADAFERVILGSGQGRPVVGLTRHSGNAGQPFSETVTGMDHLAFAVESQAALDTWRERVEQLGLAYGRPNDRLLVLRDPDNIQVELSCP